jgi:hypothetical protein
MVGLLKYAGNPAVVLSIVVAVLFGLYKWEGHRAKAAKLEAEGVRKSLAMAEAELRNAESVNRGALVAAENAAKEAERQAQIAADAEKKSRDRLRENNLLRRNIQNVTENPPVSPGLELVLDALRVRSPVSGTSGPGSSGADESGREGAATADRGGVPTGAGTPAEAAGPQHP